MSDTQHDAVFDRDSEEVVCVAWIGDANDDDNYWEVKIRGLLYELEWVEIDARDAMDGKPFDEAWVTKWNKQLVDALEANS